MTSLLYIFFYFVLSLLFFLNGTRLLFQRGKLAYKLLGIQFLILTLLIFISFFSTSEGLLTYPHLYKISSPFVYCVYPLAFLFQEFMIYPYKKFKWYHSLHFLPFLLNFVEYLPLYFSSKEVKLEFIQQTISHKSLMISPLSDFFMLSGNTHQILRLLQFFIYTLLIGFRLYRFLKKEKSKVQYKNKILIYWLIGDLFLKAITISSNLYFFIFPYDDDLVFHWENILKIIDYVVLGFLLFYFPNLLNGLTFKGFESGEQKTGELDPQYLEIDKLFATERCYLKEDISPNGVAETLNISSRKISQLIKQHTNLSFPDYVNLWRLQFIEEQLKTNPNWQKYTFEAFASESGFGSRSNFYNAFKKLKQESPGPYYKRLKNVTNFK